MYTEAQINHAEVLIKNHASLVKRIAHHLLARLPSSVQVDDLIQVGMIGLLEASRKYDPSRGASFETYAGIRIRGSMMDEVRKGDWVPRSVHKNARRISEAIKGIENRTGRDALDKDVAAELEMSLEAYYQHLLDSNGSRLFSFDEIEENGGDNYGITSERASEPHVQLQEAQFKSVLAEAIAHLPEREKLVLSLYYDQELNLKEIGEIISVSESRVSQILSQASLRLRSRLKN